MYFCTASWQLGGNRTRAFRYFWAAEHYLGANLYGRYLAHGSMQLLTAAPGGTVTPATSGWQEEGFDWNRIPGVYLYFICLLTDLTCKNL